MVEEIIRLPPDLERLTFPRHLKILQYGRVEVPESGSTENVSISNFTVVREPDCAGCRACRIEDCQRIGKELNRSVRRIVNTFLQRAARGVEGRRAVEGETNRESGRGSAKR
jgi:hypothetical protein